MKMSPCKTVTNKLKRGCFVTNQTIIVITVFAGLSLKQFNLSVDCFFSHSKTVRGSTSDDMNLGELTFILLGYFNTVF